MKLEEFNHKYRNGKEDNILIACRQAEQIMQNSKDSVHDIKHVENVLGFVDQFLIKQPKLILNYDVLMLSVFWHDIYKALHGHGTLLLVVYRHIVEGVASSNLFQIMSRKYNLPVNTSRQVCYAIRKHSQIQFLPRSTVEAKLLNDADRIDSRNHQRIVQSQLENQIMKKKLHLKIIIFYMNHLDLKIYFEENISIYKSYKNEFLAYLKAKL